MRTSGVAMLAFMHAALLMWTVLGAIVITAAVVIAVMAGNQQARRSQEARMRPCPHCRQQIPREASVCNQCGRDSSPWTYAEGRWRTRWEGSWFTLDETSQRWIPDQPEAPPPPPHAGPTSPPSSDPGRTPER